MRDRIRVSIFWAISLSEPVLAQEPPPEPVAQQVVVAAKLSDTASRRDFVAGKIIIGRKKIEESGAETVVELLKREPAVSVTGEGRIGLSGLPGYTQILVDGAPPPPGKGLDQLNLVHVEKIEIVKSAVAEFGPYGIAGTINIVSRKATRKTSTQLSSGLAGTGGLIGSNVSLALNHSETGSPVRLSTNISLSQTRKPSESEFQLLSLVPRSATQSIWRSIQRGHDEMRNAQLSGDASWEDSSGRILNSAPGLGRYDFESYSDEVRDFASGLQTRSRISGRTQLSMLIVPMRWNIKPDSKSEIDFRARLSRAQLDSTERRFDAGADGQVVREHRNNNRSRTVSSEIQYKNKRDGGHDTKLGLSALRIRELSAYSDTINGTSDRTLELFGAQKSTNTTQVRVFMQDDWRLNETLAFNLGLSGQKTVVDIDEGPFPSQTRFELWSPSLHLLKDIGGDDTRQFRMSLAQTFKAPESDQLGQRPNIHPRAPCPTAGLCGANTIDTLDSAGNPLLMPERSRGLNFEYEHGLGGDSSLTLEVFTRRISRKIGTEISLADVPWASTPRYLTRPVNIGKARVSGLNVELELALRDLVRSWPKLHVRGSLNFANSRVTALPGPDSRLEKLTPWSAKIGGSYSMTAWPVKFDLDANWAPSVWVRSNLQQRIQIPRRANFDASSRWTVNAGTRLIGSVSNMAPRTSQQVFEYETGENRLQLVTDTRKYRTFSLRLETKL